MNRSMRGAFALAVSGALSHAQYTWIARAPGPTTQAVEAVACSSVRCVAAGGDGALVETTDGKVWNKVPGVPTEFYWQSLEWSRSKFLAVGMYGWGTSSDGLHWDFQELNMSRQSWTLAGGGWTGKDYLLVGSHDSALRSADGVVWKEDSFACPSSSRMSGRFARGGGKVVIGFRTSTGCASADSGATWKEVTDSDGGSIGGFESVGFDGDAFLALVRDGIWESPDGIRWSLVMDGRSVYPRAMHADTSASVVLGWNPSTGRNVVWSRPRGGSWALRDSFQQGTRVQRIARAGWGMVALGLAGHRMVSSDGILWSAEKLPADLRSVATAKGAFHAVGTGGSLVRSEDGVSWAAIDLSTSLDLWGIAADGSRLVVVGDSGAIWSSADGSHWIRRESGTQRRLRSVVATGRRFVAAGDSGALLESVDGTDWTESVFPKKVNLAMVAARADTIYLLDTVGRILRKPDATWRPTSPLEPLAEGDWLPISPEVVSTFAARSPGGLVASWKGGQTWFLPDGQDAWVHARDFSTTFSAYAPVGTEWLGVAPDMTATGDASHWFLQGDGLPDAASLASDGKTLVAVGASGRIWTSEDRSGVSTKSTPRRAVGLGLGASRGTIWVQPVSDGRMDVEIRDVSGKVLASLSLEAKIGQKVTLGLPAGGRAMVAQARQGGIRASLVVLPGTR